MAMMCPPSGATQYLVYPLFRGEGCKVEPCNEDYTCTHTCYLHGLECSTTGFDCHAEAVKYCDGKELTMLIESNCATDLCDVDCDLGVYYSSQEHTGIAMCDGGNAPFCPRTNWASSLCQCELPPATEDLYSDKVALEVSLNVKFLGVVLCGVMIFGAIVVKIKNRLCPDWSIGSAPDEDVSFSEAELAFLSMESRRRGGVEDADDEMSEASTDALLSGRKGQGMTGVERVRNSGDKPTRGGKSKNRVKGSLDNDSVSGSKVKKSKRAIPS